MVLLRKTRTAWDLAWSYVGGWHCRDRIVVIESDDWGSIRTSSREAYDRLLAEGCPLERAGYSLDALETDEDLDLLYEVLESVRDSRGRPACLTANMIMVNPDFARIRASGYQDYVFEHAAATLARDPLRQGVEARWADGLRRGVFVPQLHGRGHIRWWEWLEALRAGSVETLRTFDLGMCGVHLDASKEGLCFYAPLYLHAQELEPYGVDLAQVISEGAALFKQQFGYRSLSTIAPNYAWGEAAEAAWVASGVRYVQGEMYQRFATPEGLIAHRHLMGDWSSSCLLYLIRNCLLEPLERKGDEVGRCLREVGAAFRMRKPAVIGVHRAVFAGAISEANRTNGLRQLSAVLKGIVKRWPDVVFLSSPELGYRIECDNKGPDKTVRNPAIPWLPSDVPPSSEAGYDGPPPIVP